MKKLLLLFLCLLFLSQKYNYVDLSKYKSEYIYVEVKGAVKYPNVYKLKYKSTIQDLLKKAKVADNADLSAINLTKSVHNQDVIVIPEYKSKKISLNSGTIEELCTLKGVGPSTAQKIIEYRKEYGSFRQIEDIMNVKGIKEKLFAKIKDQICL